MTYTPTIGLEVHAELCTAAKMFCGCKNDPHLAEANTHVCPVCLAHPGTLPVVNKEAVKMVLQFGAAVGATAATYSEFDRKNYFYPDIPKAYQISQYQFPFLTGGALCGVALTRVHLEEDTARSSHELVDGSIVDFNRAGVPLMELVTEPVLHTAAEAGAFARELQLLLQTIGISHANMERGEMRIEANISVSPDATLGTKVEVKNINSFKAVEAAIAYEIERHTQLLTQGGEVAQETRGWDEGRSRTFSQRSKETAKDYRYFPDPDLPKLQVQEYPDFAQATLQAALPDLPDKKREIYSKQGISRDIIETIIAQKPLDTFFAVVWEEVESAPVAVLAANYVSVDLARLHNAGELCLADIAPATFVSLLTLAHEGSIGSRGVKQLLPELPGYTGSVAALAEERGLTQNSDPAALQTLATTLVADHPEQVAEYRAGKDTVLKFLVGQGMKQSRGSANPQVLEQVLRDEIAAQK